MCVSVLGGDIAHNTLVPAHMLSRAAADLYL